MEPFLYARGGGDGGGSRGGWFGPSILPALRWWRPRCRYNLFIKQFAGQVMREIQYIYKHC